MVRPRRGGLGGKRCVRRGAGTDPNCRGAEVGVRLVHKPLAQSALAFLSSHTLTQDNPLHFPFPSQPHTSLAPHSVSHFPHPRTRTMLSSTLLTLASLVGLALAAPAAVDQSADLAKRGGKYGYYEPTIHVVTVGECGFLIVSLFVGNCFADDPLARPSQARTRSFGTIPSMSTPRRVTSSCLSTCQSTATTLPALPAR